MHTFDFVGFNPSKSVQELADSRLNSLLRSVPAVVSHDAYLVLTRGGGYEGAIKIYSSAGSFKASAKASDPRQVLQEVYRRVKGQILVWKLSHPSHIYSLYRNSAGSTGKSGSVVGALAT